MTQKPPLNFSVRADLFRVAQGFSDPREARFAGVRIEPLRDGGVVMVGCDGADLIALVDPSGSIDRPATVQIGKAVLNLAVDLFRRDGVNVRLKGADGIAFIDPDTSGQASREFERRAPYLDWRAMVAPHALARLDAPYVFGARMARRAGEAAIGLARAAESEDEFFELKGGEDATVVTFTAWPDAVAVFSYQPLLITARTMSRSTLWQPPAWIAGPRLALVEGAT